MHKLLEKQLKKSFGADWNSAVESPEMSKLLTLLDQSYTQYDEDYALMEHVLAVSSKELTDANKEIVKNNELLGSVTESINDLIFYKDLNFRYIGANSSFANFFGFSVETFIGKDDFELYDPQYAQLFREMDERMLKGAKPHTNNEWVKNVKGEDVFLLTTKAPLVNAKGELFGLVGISRDITKEFYLEKEITSQQAMLIQQSRLAAMGEMIGNIAHQWRQPLNTLGLIVQDIQEAYNFGEINQQYIENTSRKSMDQINYMSKTIDDFRNYFNPHKTKKSFSLLQAVQETVEILSISIKTKQITLSISVPDDLMIFGYKNEFSQVLFNLMHNAKDAILEAQNINPAIAIHAQVKGKEIQIDISDNGGGIPPEILPRIFDPYFTTKEEGTGNGIGLYMSKMIIEEHMNGSLSVRNNEYGAILTILVNATDEKEEDAHDDL